MIVLNNISHYYPRENRYILRNISWQIRDGENWVLFGRNGSGKTKLLEIISGYLFPSMGSVERFGKKGGFCDIRELRKQIGYCSSFVKEQIANTEKIIDVIISGYYASIGLYEEPNAASCRQAEKLLDSIRMQHRKNDNFGNLSYGEKQKILLLRALIHDPRLLILDEPVNGLDFPSREDFLDTLHSVAQKRQIAIIYVTHHTEEITHLFNKTFLLHNDGTIFFQGDIDKGITDAKISALFDRVVKIERLAGRYFTVLPASEFSENCLPS